MKKCKREVGYRVGDAVRTTRLLKFKFGPALASGTALRVVAVEDGGGTIKCTQLNDTFVIYPLMNYQIEPIGRVFDCVIIETRKKVVCVAAVSRKDAEAKIRRLDSREGERGEAFDLHRDYDECRRDYEVCTPIRKRKEA